MSNVFDDFAMGGFYSGGGMPVAVLGVTGIVGQTIMGLLEAHPGFELVAVAASERNVGKPYGEAASWKLVTLIPKNVAYLPVVNCAPVSIDIPIVFLALDVSVAEDFEFAFERAGRFVVTNTCTPRMRNDVALVVPEVNRDHIELVTSRISGSGAIMANPNCSAISLVLTLSPFHEVFGLESVPVSTLKALSGAAYPGLMSLEVLDNVIPNIAGEEKKIETEPLMIFGHRVGGSFELAGLIVSGACNRVAVSDGHLLRTSVKLDRKAFVEEIVKTWETWRGYECTYGLPSTPSRSIIYRGECDGSQPCLDRNAGNGMSDTFSGLATDVLFGWKFTMLTHNTIRGAVVSYTANREIYHDSWNCWVA